MTPVDARLLALIGVWRTEDSGRVQCPTGIKLAYGEQLTLHQMRASDGWLHYEHTAWRVDRDGDGGPRHTGPTLHSEYGFIRPLGPHDGIDDGIEATFVMNSGRAETGRGTVTGDGQHVRLALHSEHFLNDRLGVLGTRRAYLFAGLNGAESTCEKTMELATENAWPALRMHLSARLRRISQ